MPTLQFKGKNLIWSHHLSVPYHSLEEISELGFQPEKGEGNIIVEGDNLIALKALLPEFGGRVDAVYIDPPYNTGTESGKWVYNDNVNSPLIRDWIGKEVGIEDLTRHDKWLCMMAPRLKIINEILKENGIIFISIDDHELHHLRCLMNEIFGEENYIEIFCWTKTSTPPSLSKKSRKTIEYVLCFEKQKKSQRAYNGEELDGGDQPLLNSGNRYAKLKFPKEAVLFKNNAFPDGTYEPYKKDKVALLNTINIVDGYADIDFELEGEFKWSQDFLNEELLKGTTFIVKSDKLSIRFIRIQEGAFKAPNNLIKEKYTTPTINKTEQEVGTNENASNDLKELMPDVPFDYPKPVSLIKYLINLVNDPNAIILDSFAGSGTTMHAVNELNKDGGNRKCILVQMTEATEQEPDKNICRDITRERNKLAIEKFGYESGFKYLRVGKAIDPETMLEGELPTYSQFAEYVFYLATGGHLAEKDNINAENHFVGSLESQSIYLIYEQDFDKLTRLALTLDIAEKIIQHSPGKRRTIFAPSCFLDEDYMSEKQIEFVSVPYNLFERKTAE